MPLKKLQKIPGVDLLLEHSQIKTLKDNYTSEFIKYCIRAVLNGIRFQSKKGKEIPGIDEIVEDIIKFISGISDVSLKKVINTSGILLHTNIGRAPLGKKIFKEIQPAIEGYSNIEFDLTSGKRGKRTDHVIELLKFLTGAENAVIVNNNAAAVSLALRTFSEGKEAVISRGELVEIGGSFRLPEIIEASGTKMKEVGTTNRTRISDYTKAITKNTALILKAHKSNYSIEGFTEEVGLKELAALTKKFKLILMYDIGSGFLFNPEKAALEQEPVVKNSINAGADLVTFSCDKLLGGPQAGIIAGKNKLIEKISKNPLMRTYRVDKITIALLSAVLRSYIKKGEIINLPIFKLLSRSEDELKLLAQKLKDEFEKFQIKAEVRESEAFCGGGAMPQIKLDSYSVVLQSKDNNKNRTKNIYMKLLGVQTPVLSILRKGEIHFDVFTLFDDEIPLVAKMVSSVI